MILSSKKQIHDILAQTPDVNILGEPVICASEARNLGVQMDSELRFEKHISECVRNCFCRLKVLYRSHNCHDRSAIRVNLCESLVLPRTLYYCGPRLFARTETRSSFKKCITLVQDSVLIYPLGHMSRHILMQPNLSQCLGDGIYIWLFFFSVLSRVGNQNISLKSCSGSVMEIGTTPGQLLLF